MLFERLSRPSSAAAPGGGAAPGAYYAGPAPFFERAAIRMWDGRSGAAPAVLAPPTEADVHILPAGAELRCARAWGWALSRRCVWMLLVLSRGAGA